MYNETYVNLLKNYNDRGGEKAFEKDPSNEILVGLRQALQKMENDLPTEEIINSIKEYRKK